MKKIECIDSLCQKLKELFSPNLVILFGAKYDNDGDNMVDIDICIVTDIETNKKDMLRRAYLETDCDIPYDIFLYNTEEWDRLKKDSGSFVSRILRKGHVWYEQTPKV